jgi:hypothetical protein
LHPEPSRSTQIFNAIFNQKALPARYTQSCTNHLEHRHRRLGTKTSCKTHILDANDLFNQSIKRCMTQYGVRIVTRRIGQNHFRPLKPSQAFLQRFMGT